MRIADSLALMMGYGTGVDGLAYPGFSDICRQYKIRHSDLENIMSESLEKIQKLEIEYGFTMEG